MHAKTWLALGTLLELPGVWVRAALTGALLTPLLLLSGVAPWTTAGLHALAGSIASLVAWGPLVASIATVWFLPGGYLWTRLALGARHPSRRERALVEAALAAVMAHAPAGARRPERWYVIDTPALNAGAIGTALYLHRDLVRAPQLAAVLAHELGHLAHGDARLTLALRRLVLPPVYWLSRTARQPAPGTPPGGATTGAPGCLAAGAVIGLAVLLALVGGGLGMLLLSPLWAWYWREREYAADAYAARCGQADALVAFLEEHQALDVAVPYLMADHPATELRVDRLLLASEQARGRP